jgi:hypothetical protein
VLPHRGIATDRRPSALNAMFVLVAKHMHRDQTGPHRETEPFCNVEQKETSLNPMQRKLKCMV